MFPFGTMLKNSWLFTLTIAGINNMNKWVHPAEDAQVPQFLYNYEERIGGL